MGRGVEYKTRGSKTGYGWTRCARTNQAFAIIVGNLTADENGQRILSGSAATSIIQDLFIKKKYVGRLDLYDLAVLGDILSKCATAALNDDTVEFSE